MSRPRRAIRAGARALALGLLAACTPAAPPEAGTPPPGAPEAPDAAARDAGPAPGTTPPACAALLAEVTGDPVAPGLEAYHAALPAILLETRVTPVLWLERPAGTADPRALTLARALAESRSPRPEVRRLVRKLRDDKALLRQVVLSDGYLFAETPALARALVAELRLHDLFDEEDIVVHGKAGRRHLRREGGDYFDEGGVRQGLLLNQRAALTEAELARPLHLDPGLVRARTGARLVRPLALAADRAAVRLVWPDGSAARALIALGDGDTEVVCVDMPDDRLARLEADAADFWQWIEELVETAGSMVAERPRFDEPRDEPEGEQEDGELRQLWKKAYYKGERDFMYREEEYRVFDRRGAPVPPQVCIDFIFDTLERAAGTWYARQGQRPRRSAGFLDFDAKEGLLRRQTPAVLAFAADGATPLARHDLPAGERAPFRRRERFAAMVATYGEHLQEGDVLVIHGIREQTMKEHYHAALVLETDPLAGFPTLLADNAGFPRIRNLAAVMTSAPRRTIKHRLRLDVPWLLERRRAFRARDVVE